MPIEIKDIHGGQGAIITGREIVTENKFINAFKQHLAQDEDKFKKYRYSLSDYSAVTKVDVSTEAIRFISELCEIASEINPDVVVAIVADLDIIYGLSRMWEMWTGSIKWETMVFRSREDAEVWIRGRVKKYGIDDLTFG